MILQWTENMPPNEGCRYDHCIAETPFGRFLITWKGWKEWDFRVVDETPWGDWYSAFDSVDEAKAACQRAMNERLALCACPNPTPDPGFTFSIGPAVDLVELDDALRKFSREPWDLPPAHPTTPTPGDSK